jgi:predicted anti-sigma-YlaC factor YlaD
VRDCRRAETFDLYLEGELGPDDARDLEAHLAACPDCRDALTERRLLHEAFTSLPPLEVPPDFALSVMDRIPEAAEGQAGWLAPLASGAVALITCLLGFYLLTGQNLSDVLVAVSRSLGSAFGRLLPLLAKLWKLGGIFLKIAADFVSTLGEGLSIVAGLLGPGLLGLVLCLGVLMTLLLLYGARRLLSLGERS